MVPAELGCRQLVVDVLGLNLEVQHTRHNQFGNGCCQHTSTSLHSPWALCHGVHHTHCQARVIPAASQKAGTHTPYAAANVGAHLGVIDVQVCTVCQQAPADVNGWCLTSVASVLLEGKAKHLHKPITHSNHMVSEQLGAITSQTHPSSGLSEYALLVLAVLGVSPSCLGHSWQQPAPSVLKGCAAL